MIQLTVKPTIYEYKTFADFAKEFNLGEDDLILTNEYIYNPTISATGVKCATIFQEKYGAGEPSDVMVNGILAEMNKTTAKRVIAVGGGTIIDIAKVLVVSENDTDVNDMYDRDLKAQRELFIIPTTCGTGSEVTNIAVINRTKLGTKQGLVSEEMYAQNAVLIGEFMKTLPYGVFATSSIDALIHAVESYLSPLATSYTEMFSVEAIKDILEGYVEVAKNPDARKELGDKFLKASNYAGIAFGNAGCGAVHAMSYALGGKYHVAHGESNYQFFMAVLRYYERTAPGGKIEALNKMIAGILGGNDGFQAMEELLEKILKSKKMSEYGATQEDIVPFAESTVANQQRLLGKAYIPMDLAAVQAIFQERL